MSNKVDHTQEIGTATVDDMMKELATRGVTAIIIVERPKKNSPDMNVTETSFIGSHTKCLGMLQLAIMQMSVGSVIKPIGEGVRQLLDRVNPEDFGV